MAVPAVTSISPTHGPTAGGTSVAIVGTSFIAGSLAVAFGATAATGVVLNSATSITCVAPAHAAGAVDVEVTTSGGTSSPVAGDLFTYGVPVVSAVSPTHGSVAGGTPVTITGTDFIAGGLAVTFGLIAATSVVLVSPTSITCVSPAVAAGLSDVLVTTSVGTSDAVLADSFIYQAAPTIPGQFVDIDWTQRAQVLNQLGTLINNYITFWNSVTAAVTVPDPGSGSVYTDSTAVLVSYITALNAVNTEFTLGVTALAVPIEVDYGSFQVTVNNILTLVTALVAAKP